MAKKWNTEVYLQKLIDRDIPYWPTGEYEGSTVRIEHECSQGHKWKARPASILRGDGCPGCKSNRRKIHSEYLQELQQLNLHYTVLEPYVNNKVPLEHLCENGHTWKATPSNILRGTKCPTCTSYGFDPNKEAILYYLRVVDSNGDVYYKVGITNQTVKDRFNRDSNWVCLHQEHFKLGKEAQLAERDILDSYKEYRVSRPGILKSGGFTELFLSDVLKLDLD